MTSLTRRALSALCAIALAASMVPTSAFAENLTGGGTPDVEPITIMVEGNDQEMTLEIGSVDLETSHDLSGAVFFNARNFEMPLKAGNHEKWIDRVIVPDYAREMYQALEEACDNDGKKDYLIEDKYINGLAAADGLYTTQQGHSLLVFGKEQFATEEEKEETKRRLVSYLTIAYAAFDRDHPEVFWLGSSMGYMTLTSQDTVVVALRINDSRSSAYQSEQAVKTGISNRDRWAGKVLEGASSIGSDEGKIRYFNEWLTLNNEYNTTEDLDALGKSDEYPNAWECISALEGLCGRKGPVCEAYARAFKVLCDRSSIPCVLVDGQAVTLEGSGAHMWNYIKLEGGWYGVDVTWNDPSGGSPGKVSGVEQDKWLFLGENTEIDGMAFIDSHPVANCFMENYEFPNGPVLSAEKYEPHDCKTQGHEFGPYIYNDDATCTKDGTETRTCRYCSEKQTQEKIGTKSHRSSAVVRENEIAATCSAKGSYDEVVYCVACKKELSRAKKETAIASSNHAFGSWVTTKAPTCTAAGVQKRTCSRNASHAETRSVAKLGHAFGPYRPNGDAKVNADGTETAACSRCSATTTRTDEGSALAPAMGQTVAAAGASFTVTGAATVTYAGAGDKNATSVTVPATVVISGRTYKVTAISAKAFAGNKKLKTVKLGANVEAIPVGAFKGCTALKSVTFGAAVKTVGSKAFSGCKSLKSVTLGKNVTSIGTSAFQNCAKLAKVTVKSTKLKTIGKSAFAGCKKLSTITLKTTKLKSVGKNALKGTKAKITVKVPKKKLAAYQKLFKNKGSKTVRVKK